MELMLKQESVMLKQLFVYKEMAPINFLRKKEHTGQFYLSEKLLLLFQFCFGEVQPFVLWPIS